MNYTSTRNANATATASQAILQGISPDGGLFVPQSFPQLTTQKLQALAQKSYLEQAQEILAGFLTDFSLQQLAECLEKAYGGEKFSSPAIAPLSRLGERLFVLELWHGPTAAFKDMALQLLPQLLTVSAKMQDEQRTIAILVATSGDTGKAALEGFQDVAGTRVLVLYPKEGVSPMQKLQMTTQQGENVAVCAIEGNFDDAQNAVKAIFADVALAETLNQNGLLLSSANSINWGRLVPQIVYYISAYCRLLAEQSIAPGESVNIVVPTGNFGNILAAYYAGRMGLPIHKLICASNQNNVLTHFLETGCYNRNRPFYTTTSPSMDILISSNLERLLYEAYNRDTEAVSGLMRQLAQTGEYSVTGPALEEIHRLFHGGFCDDTGAGQEIRRVFEEYSYLMDTHTAVAMSAYRQYVAQTGDERKTILASTASPYKFPASVLAALQPEAPGDEFAKAQQLAALSGCPIPQPLQGLENRPVRFTQCCTKEDIAAFVAQSLLG